MGQRLEAEKSNAFLIRDIDDGRRRCRGIADRTYDALARGGGGSKEKSRRTEGIRRTELVTRLALVPFVAFQFRVFTSRLGFGRERRGFFPLRVEFGHLRAAPGVLQGAALDAACG